MSRFAEWAAQEFGSTQTCDAMHWTSEELRRLTDTTGLFEESTAPLLPIKTRLAKQGKASRAAAQWNSYGGPLGT